MYMILWYWEACEEMQRFLRNLRRVAETQRTCIHEHEQRMLLQSPLKSVGWLGGSSDRLVINEPARVAAEQAKGRSSS